MLTCATDMAGQSLSLGRRLRGSFNSFFCALWTFICFFPASLALLACDGGRTSHWVVRRIWVAGMLKVCGVRVTASGLENFDPRRPYVYVANHQSLFDIPAVFHATTSNLRFITKKSLFYIPFFGPYLWLAGYVSVDRGNREKAIRSHDRAAEKIGRGTPIISFPEGTRSPDGEIRQFKKGAFMMAMKAGVPLIPVSISGSNKVLSKKTWLVFPGDIRVHFSPPVPTAGREVERKDDLMAEVRAVMLENKGRLDREPAGGKRG